MEDCCKILDIGMMVFCCCSSHVCQQLVSRLLLVSGLLLVSSLLLISGLLLVRADFL